jgi:hypothetical protein
MYSVPGTKNVSLSSFGPPSNTATTLPLDIRIKISSCANSLRHGFKNSVIKIPLGDTPAAPAGPCGPTKELMNCDSVPVLPKDIQI